MSAATYLDMDRVTGAPLTDGAQLKASIQDILLTLLGSRVMRRHYSSALCDLLDKQDLPRYFIRIANRLKNDYSQCPDMWQRSISGCYQNNVAWLYLVYWGVSQPDPA